MPSPPTPLTPIASPTRGKSASKPGPSAPSRGGKPLGKHGSDSLFEMRDWLSGGGRRGINYRHHAGILVDLIEKQGDELEIARRLIEAVQRAKVMGPGWEASARRLLTGKGDHEHLRDLLLVC